MFRKECKKIIGSLAFLIFVVVMFVDFITQYDTALTKNMSSRSPVRKNTQNMAIPLRQIAKSLCSRRFQA